MRVVRETFKQGFDEPNLMPKLAEDLAQDWRSRLSTDCREQSAATSESTIYCLPTPKFVYKLNSVKKIYESWHFA